MIALNSVTISVPSVVGASQRILIDNLDLEIDAPRSLAIIGPNGSGKSTLLKAMGGLFTPSSGDIFVSDKHIGYMPQNYRGGLLSWISVDEHFKLALEEQQRFSAIEFLDTMQFQPNGRQKLASLSGGELQLLYLATLIAQSCEVLLLDEPLAAVDFSRRARAIDLLKNGAGRAAKQMVMVSHHLDDARILCDNFLVLSGGSQIQHKFFESANGIDLSKAFK